MPEVKWVERDALLDNDDKPHYAKARQQNMIPVLTLDQIEAWLLESPGLLYWQDHYVTTCSPRCRRGRRGNDDT